MVPGLTRQSPQEWTELLSADTNNCKTMHTQADGVLLHYYANAPARYTEETGRYDLAWKDWCSVLNALQ